MLGAFTSMFWGGEPLGSETTTAIDTIDREDEAGAAGSKPGDGAAVEVLHFWPQEEEREAVEQMRKRRLAKKAKREQQEKAKLSFEAEDE